MKLAVDEAILKESETSQNHIQSIIKENIEIRSSLEDDIENKEKQIKQIHSQMINKEIDIKCKDTEISQYLKQIDELESENKRQQQQVIVLEQEKLQWMEMLENERQNYDNLEMNHR